MTDAATAELVTMLATTAAAVEADFNFTGLWISVGVLVGFVFGIVLYGLCLTLMGKTNLPPTTEDKQPLTNGEVEQENEARPNETKKMPNDEKAPVEPAVAALSPSNDDAESRLQETQTQPTSADVATSTTEDLASSREDLVDGGVVNGGSVAVEVYDQDIDIADETKK